MDSKVAQRVERQRQIWEYQFGPAQARTMAAAAAVLLEEHPDRDPAEVFAQLEPDAEIDTDIVPRHA
jgi:hypothetical protein